ncbi:MAG: biotin--[acetyl-CoA-carboxylase] ligase [Lachnospiraceae bacterium]|nr:biotin--[acetyl-CoA-carboxylase] ligase [Lachnospiraceae bacterium]
MKAKILELLRRKGDYVSGQELCTILQVSRTAVWKAMQSLQKEGYRIEAVRNRGYRLVEDVPCSDASTEANSLKPAPDIYSKNEILSRLSEESGVSSVVFLDTVDSTNSECVRRYEAGAAPGLLVASDDQSLGRGRRGRTWISPPGCNVYFSFLCRPDVKPEKAPMLTLLMALAVCMGMEKIRYGEVLRTSGRQKKTVRDQASPMIKWPNDIVISGRKCCGMLTEMSCEPDYIRHVVIGVGINVRHHGFDPSIADTAISLDDALGLSVKRSLLVAEIMNEFGPLLKRFEKEGNLGFIRNAYLDRLANAGKTVRVLDPAGEYEGRARGISETGELLVELEDGSIREVNSGEVSVRGIYGYV